LHDFECLDLSWERNYCASRGTGYLQFQHANHVSYSYKAMSETVVHSVRFYILKAVSSKTEIFSDVTPCCLVERNQLLYQPVASVISVELRNKWEIGEVGQQSAEKHTMHESRRLV
jgi:hypothetical protein